MVIPAFVCGGGVSNVSVPMQTPEGQTQDEDDEMWELDDSAPAEMEKDADREVAERKRLEPKRAMLHAARNDAIANHS
eukprot:25464-Amphidinium_carterae.1